MNSKILTRLIQIFLYWLSALLFFGSFWIYKKFGEINIYQFLSTLSLGFTGLMPEIYISAINWIVITPLIVVGLLCASEYALKKSHLTVSLLVTCSLFVFSIVFAQKSTFTLTTIEVWNELWDKYVPPDIGKIAKSDQPKLNLIWIYVESLEKAYINSETLLSLEKSTKFMNDLTIAPLVNSYTIGSIMSSRCGAPLFLTSIINPGNYNKSPFNNAICIDDILRHSGYRSELVIGSDSNFTRLGDYFRLHASAEVFDKNIMLSQGYNKSGLFDNYNDEDVFRYATKRLNSLKGNTPFSLTIITLDNHAPSGFPSKRCENDYGTLMIDVVRCNSDELARFIDYLSKSGILESTVLMIQGDHPFMGTFTGVVDPRKIFAKIFAPNGRDVVMNNATPFDLFPSLLDAVGFDIGPQQVAYGFSIFSNSSYPEKGWVMRIENGFDGWPPSEYMDLHK